MSEPTAQPAPPRSRRHRLNKALMALCSAVTLSYLTYRGLYTLNLETWYATVASCVLYVAELWGGMSLLLFFLQIWEPREPAEQTPLEDVTIDVFVPSYNEEVPILRGTLQACLAMDCPHRTYLLDDGNRDEVRQLCEELGVHYIHRENNLHAKAGNLNHAFDQTEGEFVAILDADHIPEPNFLSRMIGHFRDPKLGFVQSPHAFSNFDTFQGRVNYEKGRFWDEGQLFYKVIQPARNTTDSVIFAGSATLFRREALKDVGYIATETITEDMHTGIRMSAKGWKTMYVNERLIAGQGASDVTTFHSQRLRWAEGNLSILAYDNPLTMKGLSLAQRLTYFASIIHWASGLPRLLIYITPILLLLTGISPVKEFTWTLGAIFLAYISIMFFTLRVVFRRYMNYELTEFFNMANFWTQIRATCRALIYRKRSKFVVTKKRGPQGAKWPHVVPQITLLSVGVLAIVYGWTRHVMFEAAPDLIGMGVATILVLHNSYFAVLYLRAAMMASSKRTSYRHRLNLAVQYSFTNRDGEPIEGIGVTTDLNELGLGFMSYDVLPTNQRGSLRVRVNGDQLDTEGILRYAAHRQGKGQEDLPLYRYGVDFVEMPPKAIDAASRMVQRYAVAPWYSVFENNNENPATVGRALLSRRGIERAPFKVPVSLETPKGEVYTSTRDISTEAMRCILATPVNEAQTMRAKIYCPMGSFHAQVRVAEARDVTGPPHRVREYVMTFDSFEGQGRSMLQSLCELSGEPTARRDLMFHHDERHRPFFRPMAAASLVLLALTPPTIGVFKHIHDDDLTLVDSTQPQVQLQADRNFDRILGESLRTESPDVRRLALLKDALEREGRHDDLVRVCVLLTNLRPDDPDMGLAMVAAYTGAGRYKDADATAKRWLDILYPAQRLVEAGQFELLAGRNMLRSGDKFGALEVFRRLFVANPDDRSLRTEYLGVLLELDLGHEALRQFSQLPRDEGTLRNIVTIYTALGEFDLAEEALVDLMRARPGDVSLQIELGNVLVWQGDYINAVRVFRDLREAHPDDPEMEMALGEALSWSGQGGEALRIFGGLMDQGRETNRTVKGFLDAYVAADQPTKSDGHRVHWMYKRHLHMRRLPGEVAGVLASALVRAGYEDEGIDLIKEVLSKSPTNRELRLRLADALVASGREDEAHPHYRALLADAQNGN